MGFQIAVQGLPDPLQGPQHRQTPNQAAQIGAGPAGTCAVVPPFGLDGVQHLQVGRRLAGHEIGNRGQRRHRRFDGQQFPPQTRRLVAQRHGGGIEILAQFVKEKPVEVLEAGLLQAALGKMGAQQGGELGLVQDIHPGEQRQAFLHLGGGDPQPGRPGRGRKFENRGFHADARPCIRTGSGPVRTGSPPGRPPGARSRRLRGICKSR